MANATRMIMNQSKEMVENLLRLAEKIPVPFSFWLKTLPLMSKSEVTFRVGKVMEPSAPSLLGSNLRGERFQLKVKRSKITPALEARGYFGFIGSSLTELHS